MPACVEQAVYQVISAVGTAYPVVADTNAPLPHMVYTVFGERDYPTSDNSSLFKSCTVQVTSYGETATSAAALAIQVHAAVLAGIGEFVIDGSGKVTIDDAVQTGSRLGKETEQDQTVFLKSQDYSIIYKEE